MTIEDKWDYVIDRYKQLINKNGWLTYSEKKFIDKVNRKCFNRVHMVRPSNHMIEVLYASARKYVLKM